MGRKQVANHVNKSGQYAHACPRSTAPFSEFLQSIKRRKVAADAKVAGSPIATTYRRFESVQMVSTETRPKGRIGIVR